MIAEAADGLTQWWGPAIAFAAGLVSFASPCVFPLVPGYLSYVTGESVTGEEAGKARPLPIFLFVAGFTAVFTLLGAFATTFVRLFKGDTGQNLAGAVVVAMGILLILYGLRKGPVWLYEERRPLLGKVRPGTAGAFPLGMAFAAGWTPCSGPVLGGIFALAAAGAGRGAVLMACYSLGLAVPFIALGFGAQWLTGTLGWIRRHYAGLAVVSGSLLIALGVLVMTGLFTRYLNAPLQRFAPGL